MGEAVGEEQDKERVMKGDDVNEREVWKQRFISPNPVSREGGGGGRRKEKGGRFRRNTRGWRVDM